MRRFPSLDTAQISEIGIPSILHNGHHPSLDYEEVSLGGLGTEIRSRSIAKATGSEQCSHFDLVLGIMYRSVGIYAAGMGWGYTVIAPCM